MALHQTDIKVRSIMQQCTVVCGTLDSIYDCARDMYTYNVGFLAVLDSQDRCVGVITDRDLICGGVALGLDVHSTPITTIMEPNFNFVHPEQLLDECLRLMETEGIRRVPVFENDKIVGVVSVDDLIVNEHCHFDKIAPILRRQLTEPHVLLDPDP